MLSQSRTTSSRRRDPMVLGAAKLKHRKSTMWPTTRGRDVSKEITKEFTIVSYETQYIVIRNSKIGWTEEKCIAMDKLAQEDHSFHLSKRGVFEISKTLVSHTQQFGQECTDATSIRLPSRSHNHEPVSTENQEKNVQNPFLFNSTKGGTLLLPVLHGGIGTKSWWCL